MVGSGDENEARGSATAVAGRPCPACGKENTLDSRFCRHCGTPLTAPVAAAAENGHGAPADTHATAAAVSAEPAMHVVAPPAEPSRVDKRRSRQLLDRALALSERGDKSGAMLACRQAIALTPHYPSGYAMMGLLLERGGDLDNAILAYERVISLAPNSPLERDSLNHLRAITLRREAASAPKAAPEPAAPPAQPIAAPIAAPAEAVATATPPAAAGAPAVAAAAASVTVQPVTGQPSATASAPAAPVKPVQAVAQAAAAPGLGQPVPGLPVAHRPGGIGAAGAVALPGAVHYPLPAIRPAPDRRPVYVASPDDDDTVSALGVPRWLRLVRGESSFYIQVAPLLVTAAFSMVFLLWARSVAVSRSFPGDSGVAVAAPGYQGATAPGAAAGATTANAAAPAATQGTATAPTPVPNNVPTQPPASQSGPVDVTNAPQAAAHPASAHGGDTGSLARHEGPRFPRPEVSHPTRLASRPPSDDDGSLLRGIAPMPLLTAPEPRTPPIVAVPMLTPRPPSPPAAILANPAASSDDSGQMHGSISIISGRLPAASAPARPENRARDDENAARNADANGDTSGAITRTTASIESGRGDAGWRYQQRALLHLEQGDNGSAASDFQTAISAYRDQESRGIHVDEARSGIAACQSGLRLAEARERGQ